MKSVKLIFLIALLCAALTASAQEVPVEITNGNIAVTTEPVPYGSTRTNVHFVFREGIWAFLNSDVRDEAAMSFLGNRGVSGVKYTLKPTPGVRGEVYTCQALLAHQNQPLSTRLEMTLADFRTPKFPKLPSSQQNESIEIIVPFTMTGRLSCLGDEGQMVRTYPVNGSGNATLRFVRFASYWNKVYLVRTFYVFGTTAPKTSKTPIKSASKN